MSDDHALLMQMSFDLAKLEKSLGGATKTVDKNLDAMERRAKKAAHEVEESLSFKNVNVSHALNNVLLGLKEKTLEGGTEQLGLFGSALGALGPAGLLAAAGIGAAGVALERGAKTAEWAESIEHVSRALGVTSTQLQEFDFIASATGIPVEKMRESMAGLEKTVGLVESGFARSMSVKAFTDGLKITPEQLRGWGSLDQQLPHILDAMAKLNVEERAGLASRLKIDPDVLNSLIEYRDQLGSLIDQARQYGIIMDEEAIKKSAEAGRQMKVTAAIIQGELNVAFADMAPLAAGAAKGLLDVVTAITDILRGIRNVTGPLDNFLRQLDRLPGSDKGGNIKASLDAAFPGAGIVADGLNRLRLNGVYQRSNDALDDAAGDIVGLKPKLDGEGLGFNLAKPTGKKGRKSRDDQDHTAELTEKATSDLETADKQLQEALKGLTSDVVERAAFERRAIDDDAAKETAKLQGDRAKLLADKTIEGKTSDILQAKIEQAIADVELARVAKQELLARQRTVQLMQQQQALHDADLTAQTNLLRAQLGVWQTSEDRRVLQLALFDTEERQHEEDLKAEIAQAQIAKDKQKEAELTRQLADTQATAGLRREAVSQANPGNSWDAWVQDARRSTADVGEAFAKAKVDGIDAFNQGLFDSEGRLNSLAQVARSVGNRFLVDFEQFGLKKIESGLFSGQGGGLFGLGGKAANDNGQGGAKGLLGSLLGGASKPDGSASNPFYTKTADPTGAGGLGGLSSLFGGQGAGAGLAGGFNPASLIGFAGGGSFIAGGHGGIDRNLAQFRISRGEKVTVQTPDQQRADAAAGGDTHQYFDFRGSTAEGFKRTSRQVSREARRAMSGR